MSELRDEIAEIIAPKLLESDYGNALFRAGELADRILSLPRIKEALAYMEAVDSAHPVFGEIREMLNKGSLGHSISTGTRED